MIPGDELLTSIRPVALDEDVLADVAAVDGVARVSPIATFDVARDGVRYDAAAVRGADLAADGRLTFLPATAPRPSPASIAGGVAILPRAVADRTGLTVGSTLSLALGGGKVADLSRRRHRRAVAARVHAGRRSSSAGPTRRACFGVEGADALALTYTPEIARSSRHGSARPPRSPPSRS